MERSGEVGCGAGGGWGNDEWNSERETTSLSETIPEPKSIEDALDIVSTTDSQTMP
jgi:hypothetical protein